LENRCFVIAHRALVKNDAIGNDILGQTAHLGKHFKVHYYFEVSNVDGLKSISKRELAEIGQNPHNVLIYHHSVFWPQGEEILNAFAGIKWIKYHNITPGEFFDSYCSRAAQNSRQGREQTLEMQKKYPTALWLCDSEFNQRDITNSNFTAVSPN
jgi:L-malate glycosyltransferase